MEVTTATFEREVIETRTLPVVLDFWAPWCRPCHALTTMLEKVARDYTGRVNLAKVDFHENAGLSSTFGIRSIPNVIAFRDGRSAAQFVGAMPRRQVRAFLGGCSCPRLPSARAEAHLAAGSLDEAEKKLGEVLPDPNRDARVAMLRQGIAYARAGKDGQSEAELKASLAADRADLAARASLAPLHEAKGRYREAMEALLEIVRRTKTWKDGEARRQMVAIFNLTAAEPELVSEYRRKLAAALH